MTADKSETHLSNLRAALPHANLKALRKLSDLDEYLPFQAAGLTVRSDPDAERGMTARNRAGAFVTLSNTPATQIMTRMYDPRDIVLEFEKIIDRDGYSQALRDWEGEANAVLKPRGGRNPAHMLEMALIGGPKGHAVKTQPHTGETPYDWDLLYAAVDDVIGRLKDSVGANVLPKHLIPSTPASTRQCLKIAHVLKNSAGDPWFSDPDSGRTAKMYHLHDAVNKAHRFLQAGETSLPRWPSCSFARGDRPMPWLTALDDDEARSLAVDHKRDRKIDASSFVVQLMDGDFTQALAEGISLSDVPEIDMREPDRLANHLEYGRGLMKIGGEDYFSIGRDESSWDMHWPPQLWYAVYLVYRAMMPEYHDLLTAFSDVPLLANSAEIARMNTMSPGEEQEFKFRYMDGTVQKTKDILVAKTTINVESCLRRMFAAASGNPMRFGHILVDGYEVLLDTPRDGKFLCGWSMRSGNFCTFLANSIGNWIKSRYIERASQDTRQREKFEEVLGYLPPEMKLKWFVCRGDDAGDIWEVKDRREGEDWKISELVADWLTFVGANANAKKQEASDIRGVWKLGFAQVYTDEDYPRGVSSCIRVLERNIWNEADEVVTHDPDTGEDLRPYLEMMNTIGRINVLWGQWGRAVHPRAKEVTAFLQDIDARNRAMPPLNAEERKSAARAFALKLVRRGQLPSSKIDAGIKSFWATDLADFLDARRKKMPKLESDWSPIVKHPDGDARVYWRDRKNLGTTLAGKPAPSYPD